MSLPEIQSTATVTQPTYRIGTENDTSVNKEELVAEIGAAFVGGSCNIAPQTIENSAAYIQGLAQETVQWQKISRPGSRQSPEGL